MKRVAGITGLCCQINPEDSCFVCGLVLCGDHSYQNRCWTHRDFTSRTAHEAKCTCGWKSVILDIPPRETMCPKCGEWIEFKERTWVGPTYKKQHDDRYK